MKYQVNFEYKQIGHDGKPLRSRGTQVRLTVEVVKGIYLVSSTGDETHGRGETVKDAILDWLSNSTLPDNFAYGCAQELLKTLLVQFAEEIKRQSD